MNTRRTRHLGAAGIRAAFLFFAVLACGTGLEMRHDATAAGSYEQGLLEARPHAPPPDSAPVGEQRLGVAGGKREGLLLVPAGYRPEQPAPLVVLLHGAGARAEDILPAFRSIAERLGIILLVPSSVGRSWDVIVGDYGPDVQRLDAALRHVFARYAVDPKRIGVAGFSDGASYALSLGVMNGTLFTDILAFSPGFTAPTTARGHPKIFISHGVEDTVLPIDRCSRRIVPLLQAEGYDVTYREFTGGHVVPSDLAEQAFQDFAAARAG